MKSNENIAIVLLLITAGILTGLVVATLWPARAYADASVRRGDYIACAGEWTRATDLVYILDVAVRKLNVYFADRNAKALKRVDQVDLKQAFQ